jgi:hypothetical protein
MNYKKVFVTAIVLSFHSAAFADGGQVTADYLAGKWSLDGKEGCSTTASKYVLFRENGTAEVGRGDQATRVGFWKIANNTIIGHTLTAPTQREDYHPFFRDSYRYEYMSPQIVSAEQDVLSVTVGSDLEKETFTLTRCP